MPNKKSQTQKKIDAYCEHLHRHLSGFQGKPQIIVQFYRSRMWGYCTRVVYNDGEKVASEVGYGYDKESAILSRVLCELFQDDFEKKSLIRSANSAGVPAVIAALQKTGYQLTMIVSGPDFNVYELEALAPAEVAS